MLYALLFNALAQTEPGGAHETATHTPQPPAEVIFNLFGVIPVTNAIFTAWMVIAVLVLFAYIPTRNLKMMPTGLQNFWELVVELWIGIVDQSMGRRGRRFMPIIATSFLFIVFSNWIGIVPLIGPVTVLDAHGDKVPLFRSANSDLNVTASMAVIVVLLSELMEMKSLGPLGYIKGLLLPNPLRWMEILTRPLSLAFRLFGNIFAGEVLVATMIAVAPFALFVFLGLEIFVGLIQALIFSMLTLVYLTIATAHEHAHGDEGHGEPVSHAAETTSPSAAH